MHSTKSQHIYLEYNLFFLSAVTTADIVEVASYGSHATSKTSNVLNASTEESTIDYHKFMHEPPTVTEEKSTKDKIKEEISQVVGLVILYLI